MKELEYPFDPQWILAKRKRIRRQLLAEVTPSMTKKIAILGGSTTSDVAQTMELFLLNQGIAVEIYESEYNQYYEDAVFDNPELEDFAPDIIYVYTTNRNITAYPTLADDAASVDALLQAQLDKFTQIWKELNRRYSCPIIQNNFDLPTYRLLGNKDASDIHGAVNFITRLNMAFYAYAQEHEDFYICDLNYISADYGLSNWHDEFYWHMYKYAMSVPAIPHLSYNVANIIKSIFGKNKKGFVLDLDNTLWGGVIGDDGVDGIELGPEEPGGRVYTDFQAYIKAHQQLGVILNIDSKNDHENAIAGLGHPDSLLAPDDFICIKANWEPKSENYKAIAAELNLLPESMVFVDDNPAERHIVAEQLPGVAAPNIGESQDYIRIIDRSGFFETTTISADDLKRNEMYKENAKRSQLQASFANYGEYLQSLEMSAEIRPFEGVYMARIAQLTNKSNQFNLTTKRYTQDEIEAVAASDDYIELYGKLVDRFGDNGVVSVIIGHVMGEVCDMDLWIMSCRVLKRDMEFAMMDELVARCQKRGIKRIVGHFYPTAKNKMVKDFYGLQGFTKVSEDEAGNSEWELDLTAGYEVKNQYIALIGPV